MRPLIVAAGTEYKGRRDFPHRTSSPDPRVPALNRAVLKKCLVEARLLFAATAAMLFAFCWVRVFIVSRLQMSQFAAIVEQIWDQFKDFSPVPLAQLLSYTGRIAIGYNEPIVVFGISIFAIARGSDAVSGELGRGTMEMLLAQPVSRLQVLYTQALVTISCLFLLCVLTWAGTTTGIYTTQVTEEAPPPTLKIPGLGISIPLSLRKPEKVKVPMRERTEPKYFAPGAVNLFCLGVALAGFSTLASSFDRYRWRTIGIVVTCYVVSLILKILGQAIDDLAWMQKLSLFTAYEPQKFISLAVHDPAHLWALTMTNSQGKFELGPLGYNLILLTIGGVSYLAAGVVFHKRDLPAPL
jgi:ABC-2 type transport system permease protein